MSLTSAFDERFQEFTDTRFSPMGPIAVCQLWNIQGHVFRPVHALRKANLGHSYEGNIHGGICPGKTPEHYRLFLGGGKSLKIPMNDAFVCLCCFLGRAMSN